MAERILDEHKFDIENYIEKRLLEVSDLSERKRLRETLTHVFMNLYHHMEEEYGILEDKILQEFETNRSRLVVTTGMIAMDQFDETEESMIPMDERDTQKREIDTGEMLEYIQGQVPYFLYTVFLESDYRILQGLEREKRKFKGVIYTNYGQYNGIFTIKKNNNYLKMIESLYLIFATNKLPWSTVCAPYLNKLFDVSICQVEDLGQDVQIEEIRVDFEEYEKYVRYDCIPLWNISTYIEKSSAYPEPCLDKVHFEHIIYRHRLDEEMDYLVGMMDMHLLNVKRIQGDLFITCEEEYPVKWVLYKFGKVTVKKTIYPVFSNGLAENFSESLSSHYQMTIKTEAEMDRFITGMGYGRILTFTGYEIQENPAEIIESYNMDYFIEDEFRTGNNRKILSIEFHANDVDYYMNRDIMSYLVTQIQKKFPEYFCIGKLK